MGRYAFFSTGVEYKFAFGIQGSIDMMKFGGKGNLFGNSEENGAYHEWIEKEIPYIQRRLTALEQELCLQPFPMDRYEKSMNGTQEMIYELEKEISKMDGELQALYVLGCLIYHQLTYTEKLRVHYEV